MRGRFGARVRGSCAGLPCSSAAKVRKARTADISRAADDAPEPLRPAIGQEGAQVRRVQVEQRKAADFLAAMAAQEFDQAMGGGDIGAHRVRAAPPVMGKMASPARGKRLAGMPFPF